MSLRDVRISLTKAKRYYAAGMHKYALRNLMKAELAYEKVTASLREKLEEAQQVNDTDSLVRAAYDHSGTVERAIELGMELEEFRKEMAK